MPTRTQLIGALAVRVAGLPADAPLVVGYLDRATHAWRTMYVHPSGEPTKHVGRPGQGVVRVMEDLVNEAQATAFRLELERNADD